MGDPIESTVMVLEFTESDRAVPIHIEDSETSFVTKHPINIARGSSVLVSRSAMFKGDDRLRFTNGMKSTLYDERLCSFDINLDETGKPIFRKMIIKALCPDSDGFFGDRP